jgi:hypothetical protein
MRLYLRWLGSCLLAVYLGGHLSDCDVSNWVERKPYSLAIVDSHSLLDSRVLCQNIEPARGFGSWVCRHSSCRYSSLCSTARGAGRSLSILDLYSE